MQITRLLLSVRELCENYSDNGDGGVYGYNNRLTIRPEYQREFCFKDKQRDAVIETVMKNFPLGLMYWAKTGPDTYEVFGFRAFTRCRFRASAAPRLCADSTQCRNRCRLSSVCRAVARRSFSLSSPKCRESVCRFFCASRPRFRGCVPCCFDALFGCFCIL